MITAAQISDGGRYMTHHLSSNDYYSEGEAVTGFWLGKGAEKLGLKGDVKTEQYEALRRNQHPETGEKLTPRRPKVEFHDVVISAPKAFSIAAMVGEDERLLFAFRESVEATFEKLERYAGVRVRSGNNVKGEGFRTTGIATAAVYIHDTSRLLDPQCHAHVVFANHSYCDQYGGWLALQPRQMMEATKNSLRSAFYRDLAIRVKRLGYEIVWRKDGFGIVGISAEMEKRFSRRSSQRLDFEERYRKLFGTAPTKERVEQFIKEGKSAATTRFKGEFSEFFGRQPSAAEISGFVKDARSAEMKTSSKAEVYALQQGMLSRREKEGLSTTVQAARLRHQAEIGLAEEALRQGHEPRTDRSAGQGLQGQSKKQSKHREARKPRELLQPQKPKEKRRDEAQAARQPHRQPAAQSSRAALCRQTAIQRMKRGQDISAALRGYPMALIAKQVRRHGIQKGYSL